MTVRVDAPEEQKTYCFRDGGACFCQLRTLEEWDAMEAWPHPLHRMELGLNRFSHMVDFPHTVSLGAARHLVGSVFQPLTQTPGCLTGGTAALRVQRL